MSSSAIVRVGKWTLTLSAEQRPLAAAFASRLPAGGKCDAWPRRPVGKVGEGDRK